MIRSARQHRQGGWLVLSLALALSAGMLLAAGGLRWLQPGVGLADPGHVLSLQQQRRVGRALAAYAVERLTVSATDEIAAMGGLALWMDAADASTITLTDGRVSEWRDRRNTGIYMSKGFSTRPQPLYGSWTLNGNPVLRFSGNESLTTSTPLNLGTQISIFVVARLETASGSANGLTRLINGYTNFRLFAGSDANHRVATFYGTGTGGWPTTQASSTTSWLNQWHAVTSVNDGTDRQYINGVASPTRVNPLGAFNSYISLGGVFGNPEQTGQMWTGEVAELLMFSRAVTDPERQQIEVYLAQKWGLTTTSSTTRPPLPCPADPSAPPAGRYAQLDDAGLESRTNGRCAVQVGLLPWQTLGLQRRDAFDRFGQPLTYAVTPTAANTPSVSEAMFCGSAPGLLNHAADAARLVGSRTGLGTAAASAAEVPLLALISHGQDREGAYDGRRQRPARPNEGNDAQRAQERNYDEADEADNPGERARQLAAAPVNMDRNSAYFDDLVWLPNARTLLELVKPQACR